MPNSKKLQTPNTRVENVHSNVAFPEYRLCQHVINTTSDSITWAWRMNRQSFSTARWPPNEDLRIDKGNGIAVA